jgi:hypothetical protein
MGSGHNNRFTDGEKQKTPDAAPLPDALNLKKYAKLGVIGRGGFGRVMNR